MRYHQITPDERYTLSVLRKQGFTNAEMARFLGRHRSSIGREFYRNASRYDGAYRPSLAQENTNGRRSFSRRNTQFTSTEWDLIDRLLQKKFSPEQISGWLRLLGLLEISHQTIYTYVKDDKKQGGTLWKHLRQPVRYRKRYATIEKRGRLLGKPHISERPAAVAKRKQIGHWEMDIVVGVKTSHCIVTLVERVTGATMIGRLRTRQVVDVNRRVIAMIQENRHLFRTITVDNGPEFHGYKQIEAATGVKIYFANPYASWERGTNENTNGLVRQYVPKRTSMKRLTQERCSTIAADLNNRPRKRHGFRTPLEVLSEHLTRAVLSSTASVAVQT